MTMATVRAQDTAAAFQMYDLTLTDRELDDFLSFMEHQTTGCRSHNMPQLPDAAAEFPGLQLQPHTDSPSTSEGCESEGAGPPVVGLPDCMGSSASFRDAAVGSQGSPEADNNASWQEQHMLPDEEQLPASCVMDFSEAALPQLEAVEIKLEAADEEMTAAATVGIKQQGSGPAEAPGPALQLQAAAAGSAPSSTTMPGQSPAAAAAPAPAPAAASNGAAGSTPFATVQQPAAMALQGLLSGSSSALSLPVALAHWPSTAAAAAAAGTAAAGGVPGGQQALPQVVFIQGPAAVAATTAAACSQQQQQQQHLAATLNRAASLQQRSAAHAAAARQSSLLRCASLADGGVSSSSGGKGQISHSTIEKQRRDRLNSLIDELSEIVPASDPKYGIEASAVRRPKHVVLSDTLSLLKALQAKLQMGEAEICSLKQQAAAATALAAASHQHQQGLAAAAHSSAPAPAPAGLGGCGPAVAGAGASAVAGAVAGAALSAGAEAVAGAGAVASAGAGAGLPANGVLVEQGVQVEQGVGCLFVKVTCRDRKGLLADVVGALRTLPVVICSAAITTTQDGAVHDVFEVRVEGDSVTPQHIQCAVHMSLFNSERARGKRLRQDEPLDNC